MKRLQSHWLFLLQNNDFHHFSNLLWIFSSPWRNVGFHLASIGESARLAPSRGCYVVSSTNLSCKSFTIKVNFWIEVLKSYTAMKIRLHTIAILWRKIGVIIHDAITYPKSAATPLTGWLQWGTIQPCISRGCNTADLQSWHFGFEATFFAILYSMSRSSGGPGSIPGRADFESPQLCSLLSYKDI